MSEEKEFDPTLDSPAVNAARVYKHVLQKGFQMGGVVGCALVTPIVLFRHIRAGGQLGDATPKVLNAIFRTVLATTAVSGIMCTARLATSPDFKVGVEDRAYRLFYNKGQNRADLFAAVGTALGGTAAVALLPASAAVVVGAGAVGAAAGIVTHVATATKEE